MANAMSGLRNTDIYPFNNGLHTDAYFIEEISNNRQNIIPDTIIGSPILPLVTAAHSAHFT